MSNLVWSGYEGGSKIANTQVSGNYQKYVRAADLNAISNILSQIVSTVNSIEAGGGEVDLSNYITSNTFTTTLKDYALSADLADVATTGKYTDLTDKPELATVATTGKYTDLTDKPELKTVATTGSYTDLDNKPVIPEYISSFVDADQYVKIPTETTRTPAILSPDDNPTDNPDAMGISIDIENNTNYTVEDTIAVLALNISTPIINAIIKFTTMETTEPIITLACPSDMEFKITKQLEFLSNTSYVITIINNMLAYSELLPYENTTTTVTN